MNEEKRVYMKNSEAVKSMKLATDTVSVYIIISYDRQFISIKIHCLQAPYPQEVP